MQLPNNLSDAAATVIAAMPEEAADLGHNYLGTEHLLLALSIQRPGDAGTTAARALQAHGVDHDRLKSAVQNLIGRGHDHVMTPQGGFTPHMEKVFELAEGQRLGLQRPYIRTEHLLLALIEVGNGVGAIALKRCEVNQIGLVSTILELMSPAPSPPSA